MKMITKVLLTAAALVVLAVPAMAADKLVVKNSAGTADVFKVDDSGSITAAGVFKFDPVGGKVGFASANPLSSFHMVDTSTSTARGLIVAQHNGDTVTWSTGFHAANINLRKSRGIETDPKAVQWNATDGGDYIATIHAQAYDGAAYQNGASFAYRIDGPVTANSTPTALFVYTGDRAPNKLVNFKVMSNGNVGIGMHLATPTSKLQVVGLPTYADNAAATAAGLTAGAFYRTATGVLMVRY